MVTLVFWMPKGGRAKCQFLVGLVIYFFTGPFLTILIQFYTMWHLDAFSWGKTRQVVSEDNSFSNNDAVSEADTRPEGLEDAEATVGFDRVRSN